jgi:hypothetical protein
MNAALLEALAASPDTSLRQLTRLTASSEARISTHLGRLAAQGIAQSPQCCPNRSWVLTAQGRKLALSANPMVLDDTDKRLLAALVHAPMRQLVLSRRVGVCSLTVRRRAELLIGRGLLRRDAAKRFSVTDAGLAALGPDIPRRPAPWVRPEAAAASLSRHVQARHGEAPTDDRTRAMRSQDATLAAAKAAATMRLKRHPAFNRCANTTTG